MSIRTEWEQLLESGVTPCFEYQIGEDEHLLVDVVLSDDDTALIFSFDDVLYPTSTVAFSGEVEKVLDHYEIKIDPDMPLHQHLEQVNAEMTEGYIIPNGLYFE